MEQQDIQEILLDMQHSIRCDIYGDIYGHEYWAEEINDLRQKLKEANSLIAEMRDYLQNGGYIGQDAGLIYECMRFLGELEIK